MKGFQKNADELNPALHFDSHRIGMAACVLTYPFDNTIIKQYIISGK